MILFLLLSLASADIGTFTTCLPYPCGGGGYGPGAPTGSPTDLRNQQQYIDRRIQKPTVDGDLRSRVQTRLAQEFYNEVYQERLARWDYHQTRLISPPGAFRIAVETLYWNSDDYWVIHKNQMSQLKIDALTLANFIAEGADDLNSKGDADASRWLSVARETLNWVIGIDPYTAVVRYSFELYTDKNMFTGQRLSRFERAVSYVGLVTLGLVPKGIVTVATKLGTTGFSLAANAIADGRRLTTWLANHKVKDIWDSVTVNKMWSNIGHRAPFKENSRVIEVTVGSAETGLARVHKIDNQNGQWLLHPDDIKGLTPEQIQFKFFLPKPPTHISDAILEPGQSLLIGEVGRTGTRIDELAIQYYAKEPIRFTNMRDLHEFIH